MGNLEPSALLIRGKKEWYIDSISNLGRHEYAWDTEAEARQALQKSGYEIPEEPFTYSGDYKVTHLRTKQALEELQSLERDYWNESSPCYVRYGDLPPDGKSKNYADGTQERGVSVLKGRCLPTGEAKPLIETNQQYGSYLTSLMDRPLYIVSGEEAGMGSDGEPILINAKKVRKAKIADLLSKKKEILQKYEVTK